MKTATEIFIFGSIITVLVAVFLWHYKHPILAADVILISPFPCPPGIPC